MASHRTLDGAWVECDVDHCELPFHVELSPEEAATIPDLLFEQLAEVMDPAHEHNVKVLEPSMRQRFWLDAGNRKHRDYDLPAVIRGDGRRMWFHHDRQHRGGGKPARIDPDGRREWWVNGRQHREDGPATIEADGTSLWYWQGHFIKYDPDNRPERFHFSPEQHAAGLARWEEIMRSQAQPKDD